MTTRSLLLRCLLGSLVSLAACGDDDGVTGPVDGSVLCVADRDCDDGVFCNGVERCEPTSPRASALGCAPG
ncbi:MAG TPA: hypothetical protein RMG45_28345, partial [Polyangiaceae bacterium LLY-WYZ-15_(1-7)]|nr:hypothetical protein [Polyangiaceae bacterium LLY-WYZ-15_(1-7)]